MGILGGQALRRSCFQRDEKEKKLAGVGQAPAGVGCSFTEKKGEKTPVFLRGPRFILWENY